MNGTAITRGRPGACAVSGCDRTQRQSIADRGRWVNVSGEVYASERRTLVVHSWAGACEEHADQTSDAVRADVQEWAERWQIVRRVQDYATNDPTTPQVDARGDGSPTWSLF